GEHVPPVHDLGSDIARRARDPVERLFELGLVAQRPDGNRDLDGGGLCRRADRRRSAASYRGRAVAWRALDQLPDLQVVEGDGEIVAGGVALEVEPDVAVRE